MRNHINKPLLLMFALVWTIAIWPADCQVSTGDVKTSGGCSPVVIQPKDGFQIICHDSTLTRAEALKQAKQISELLSRLRATSPDAREMIKKLDQILHKLNTLDAATADTSSKLALSAAPIFTIPVIDGVATPDLSHGLTQRVVLHSDIVIVSPRLPPTNKPETIYWTLFVDQDGAGNHRYQTQFMEPKTNWPGLIENSRSSFELITDSTGTTVMRSVPIVNPLPSESAKK